MSIERATILIVDDDEVSIMAIRRALARHDVSNPVQVANDGLEAFEILRGGLSKPFIVLLDINMPRMTGLEFLPLLREDPWLRNTVVFVVTTSDAPLDISRAYDHQIAGYILKEDAYRSIGTAIAMLSGYLEIVTLPR